MGMKILILGGTVFLGRHLTELALARGYEVTLFHRGKRGADLFPDVERRIGDRLNDLSALARGEWDAVLDTSGQHPAAVRSAARLLSGRAGHYTFTSTISVFSDFSKAPVTLDSPLHEPAPLDELGNEMEGYGPRKVGCEVQATTFDGPVAVVRPGLIVGPYDPTERFTWWVRRAQRGGALIAPGPPERPVQLIDARDLAGWMLDLAAMSFAQVIAALPGPEGTRAVWMDESFLLAQEVGPWMELPLWVPEDMPGFQRVDCSGAIAAGLSFRPIAETARDTRAWAKDNPPAPGAPKTGLSPEREAALLAAWAAR